MSSGSERGQQATVEQMRHQHIFVVNGSVQFLDIMRELFQEEQYNVTTTNYVPETFAQIRAASPDLLIIDLAVGESAGWDLLAALRQEATTYETPVILVSTTAQLLDRAKGERAALGGDRYLVKPFDLDDLLGMVRELIGTA